jgi:hypothetical protein
MALEVLWLGTGVIPGFGFWARDERSAGPQTAGHHQRTADESQSGPGT